MTAVVARAAQLRRSVLETAAELLAVRPEVSMAEIAEAAGIGRATLYRYYDSREALLRDLGLLAADDATRALGEAHLAGVGVEEAIARAFRALVGVGARYAVVLREAGCQADDEAHRAMELQLRELVARGQVEGVLHADVPVEWLMAALKGCMMSAIELAREVGAEDAAAFGARQFLGGAVVH